MNIETLLFDLDGTLFDTREANYISYKKAFFNAGKSLTREEYFSNFGLCFDDLVNNVYPLSTQNERNKIATDKSLFYKESFSSIKLNQSLKSILINNKSRYKTAVVTTASRNNVVNILKYFELHELFDFFVCGEDVENGKPSPDCYIYAMNLLNTTPSRSLIFEDSPVGLRAAYASNASVVNVSGWC
jgi:beta-phosphoglucomutase